jgi:hypothetical protein
MVATWQTRIILELSVLCSLLAFIVPPATAGTHPCSPTSYQAPQGATEFGKKAGDFTIKTLDGAFHFAEYWNSCDIYLFVKTFHVADDDPSANLSQAAQQLWRSDFRALFEYSPENVHYFFVSWTGDKEKRQADQAIVQENLEQALANLNAADRQRWQQRVHIVDENLTRPGAGWLSELGPESFLIDRNQTVRRLGIGVYSPLFDQDYDFLKLTAEVDFANFRWHRQQEQTQNPSDLTIQVLENAQLEAGWGAFKGRITEFELPSADQMQEYDQLIIDLQLSCEPGPDCRYESGNFYYDRLIEAFLCRNEQDDKCDLELARWVTPFGRGGRWVHDITPMLALLADGGKQRLRFHTVDRYQVDLSLRLIKNQSPDDLKPFAYEELGRGGPFDSEYNNRQPHQFQVPEGTRKVELVTTTTGHGWGQDEENCAEFCVTDHEWTINDKEPIRFQLDGASDQLNCFFATNRGVIPNQPGTWYFGRGGWCPGLQVNPRRHDITSMVQFDQRNKISYRGLFKGKTYEPQPDPNGNEQGYPAEINLRSYLIFYR